MTNKILIVELNPETITAIAVELFKKDCDCGSFGDKTRHTQRIWYVKAETRIRQYNEVAKILNEMS